MRINLRGLIAPMLAAIIAAGAAQAAVYQWSKTAASNATADASIDWSEGMSPSAVNDSARAMMARVAEYRDDISGALTTAGSATAYTVTTNQGLPSTPTTGQLLAFTVHATNGADATLSADGGTAYAIQSVPGTAVSSGTLVLGTPYTAKFNGTAWILRDFYANPNAVPVGSITPTISTTAPNSNFVLAYGQCVSRTTYATLFAMVSTTFGACDGTTTFGLPDLRGRVLAGKDDMGGTAAGRITAAGSGVDGTALGAAGGAQTVSIAQANLPSVNFAVTIPAGQGSHGHTLNTQGNGGAGALVGTGDSAGANNFPTGKVLANTLPEMTGTAASGGSGTALNKLPPTIIVNYLLRII